MRETDRLGEKELSLKLCMLLALTARSRASGIHHLDISLMVNAGDKVTFHFHKLQKSWRKGNPSPFLTVYAYSPDKQLCVVQTLNRYLEMTKDSRDPSRTQLFLSYRKPYKEIVSSTVSGWIKKVLQLANVDTNVFKGHSTRSASTSKVNLKGLLYQIYYIGGHGQEHQLGKNFTIIKLFHQKRNSSMLFSKTIDIRFKRGRRDLGTRP